MIYWIQFDQDIPDIHSCISIRPDLSLAITSNKKTVHKKHLKDLVPGTLETISQLLNVMARVKAWCENQADQPPNLLLEQAVAILEESAIVLEDSDSAEHKKINFIVEQLKLISKQKYGRNYSPQLTIIAFVIHAASPSAYEALLSENTLCLPSVSTIKKGNKRVNSSSGLDNRAYLRMRVSKLNQFERTVILLIDEIYIAKRVEYSSGEVQGLTPDGSVASTLLCFMIKSLAGKYKDIVSIYPMATLTAEKLNECYKEVANLLREMNVTVAAISVDNAATNRKFFVDFLCDGNLKTHIIDSVTEQPVYLIFDPVHTFKNVYNNFQSRKHFHCPSMNPSQTEGCESRFQDIVDLYNYEAIMSLKKAHKLNPSVLEPKSIQKTSVKLAVAVFGESTRDALRFYTEHENKKWNGTADFLTLIIGTVEHHEYKKSHERKA